LLPLLLLLGCPRKPPEPVEDTLSVALSALGRDRESLRFGDVGASLPEAPPANAAEAGYTLATRYPAIDEALARPLALPPRLDAIGSALDVLAAELGPKGARTDLPHRIVAALRPVQPAPPASAASVAAAGPLPRHRRDLPLPSELIAGAEWKLRTAHLPEGWRVALEALLGELEARDREAEGWTRDGSPPTRPTRAAEEFFLDADDGSYRVLTHPTGVALEFLDHGARFDTGKAQFAAAGLATSALTRAAALLASSEELPPSTGPLLLLDTALGPVRIGSTDTDEIDGDYLLVIDPGGDDRWNGGAGSNVGLPSRVALAIDLGGDDAYRSDRPHVQGAGMLGVGVLVDFGEGRDEYTAGSQAQGAGFLGVGLLWDDGGDDRYQADSFAQGAGTFGVGLLVDAGGADTFTARARGQGFGSTGGLGVLVDFAGNDDRRIGIAARPALSPSGGAGQGAGLGVRPFPFRGAEALHGGTGLLYDFAGDDRYYVRGLGQGAAYFLSLGVLLDRAGNDTYVGEEIAQGSAAHLAAGVLIDGAGRDLYSGTVDVMGAASNRSTGILWDRGGDDDGYKIARTGVALPGAGRGGLGFARQPRALGIAIDEGGDDVRVIDQDGLGAAVPAERPGWDPLGLLLDLGGTDRYEQKAGAADANPADGASWPRPSALGMDRAAGRLEWDHDEPAVPGEFGAAASAIPPADPATSGDDLRFAEADALRRQWLLTPPDPSDPAIAALTEAASAERSPRVRRAIGRALAAALSADALPILLSTVALRSEDNDPASPVGSLVAWLETAYDTDVGFDEARWALVLRDRADRPPSAARLRTLALLDRCALSAEAGRAGAEDALLACTDAVATAPTDARVRARASRILAVLAAAGADPETAPPWPTPLADDLATAAVSWAPDCVLCLVAMARARLALGEPEGARRALTKIELIAPDTPELRLLVARLPAAGP
jgi:hypothetical protein